MAVPVLKIPELAQVQVQRELVCLKKRIMALRAVPVQEDLRAEAIRIIILQGAVIKTIIPQAPESRIIILQAPETRTIIPQAAETRIIIQKDWGTGQKQAQALEIMVEVQEISCKNI